MLIYLIVGVKYIDQSDANILHEYGKGNGFNFKILWNDRNTAHQSGAPMVMEDC